MWSNTPAPNPHPALGRCAILKDGWEESIRAFSPPPSCRNRVCVFVYIYILGLLTCGKYFTAIYLARCRK